MAAAPRSGRAHERLDVAAEQEPRAPSVHQSGKATAVFGQLRSRWFTLVLRGEKHLVMKAGTTIELLTRRGQLPLEQVSCYLCGRTDGPVLVDDPPFKVLHCAG